MSAGAPHPALRLTLALLVAGGTIGCPTPDDAPAGDSAVDPDPDPAGAARAGLGVVFDPVTVNPGERVGGLEVVEKDVQLAVDATPVGSIRFRGEVALTGRRIAHFDADAAAQAVCFEADSASAMRLPRWQGDRRRPWFCLGNRALAQQALGAEGDSAAIVRIVIDEFTIHRGLTDQVNSARLVRRIEP